MVEVLALLCSDGPCLKKFMKNPGAFKSRKLKYVVKSESFSKTRVALVTRILDGLDERYQDVQCELLSSCRIASFKAWPVYPREKDLIKG